MRYDQVLEPAPSLLRAADPTHLCLACHDGSRPEAPDVVAPVTYLPDPAGGWFTENPLGSENPRGHDLLPASPTPAPGGPEALVLSCTSCHGPHGTSSYRNLLLEPPGNGNAAPVFVVVNELVSPDGSNPVEVYDPANLFYKSGMAAWCNDCHNDFHGRTPNEEGSFEPWLRHPQSERISGAHGADFAHWSTPLPDRVPVESPADDEIPSSDDQVFCLSCHKAHGSDRPAGLIYADGETKVSTCQQCHNQ